MAQQQVNAAASSSKRETTSPPADLKPLPADLVPAEAAGPSSTAQPPLPPAAPFERALRKLDELFALEATAQDNRSRSRKKTRAGSTDAAGAPGAATVATSCNECRRLKVRCQPEAAGRQDCVKCVASGTKCVWPELGVRGPKKGLTKKQRLIEGVRLDIMRMMEDLSEEEHAEDEEGTERGAGTDHGYEGSPASTETDLTRLSRPSMPPQQASFSGSSTAADEKDHQLYFRNPLSILTKGHPLLDRSHTGSPSDSQYYDGGLYQELPEDDFSLDPVSLGLMTHADFCRLLDLYFDRLRHFYTQLDRVLHTPEFLRLNSPFLTTAIASVAASYDPLSRHIALGLQRHAETLAVRCFEVGWKSVEVIQAFGLLSHYASPGKSWRDDRMWLWQGMALRLATDIRLDLHMEPYHVARYRAMRPLTADDGERIKATRFKTWDGIIQAEMSQGIQTGRVEAIVGMYLGGEPRDKLPAAGSPEDVEQYNYGAHQSVNLIVARALFFWADLRIKHDNDEQENSTLRDAFRDSWWPEMERWRKEWPHINGCLKIFADKICVVLLLISLRFPGGRSTVDILTQARSISISTLQTIVKWDDEHSHMPLGFASNFVVLSIAFSTVFLLKLANLFDAGPTPELHSSCLHAASILERIGQFRSNGFSIATIHAQRIRALLAKSRPEQHSTQPSTSGTSGASVDGVTSGGLQEVFFPTFGPGDAFVGLGDDALSLTWPESFSNAAVDFFDAATWDPMMGFGE